MAYIRKNGIWRPDQVPLCEFELIREHPLAQGLGCYYATGSRYGLQDLTGANLQAAAIAGSITTAMTPIGPAMAVTGSSTNRIRFANAPGNQPTGDWTLWAFNQQQTSGNGGTVFGKWFSSGTWGFDFKVFQNSTDTAPVIEYHDNGGDQSVTFNARALWNSGSNPQFYMIATAFSFSNAVYTNYYNGGLDGTGHNGTAGVAISNAPMSIGCRYDNGTDRNFGEAKPPACGVYTRQLTAAEVYWLYKEPFAMFRPRISRKLFYISRPAGATVYNQTVSATTTPNAAIVRQTGKPVAANTTPNAAIARSTRKPVAATTTPTGTMVRATSKIVTIDTTPVATIPGTAPTTSASSRYVTATHSMNRGMMRG